MRRGGVRGVPDQQDAAAIPGPGQQDGIARTHGDDGIGVEPVPHLRQQAAERGHDRLQGPRKIVWATRVFVTAGCSSHIYILAGETGISPAVT